MSQMHSTYDMGGLPAEDVSSGINDVEDSATGTTAEQYNVFSFLYNKMLFMQKKIITDFINAF